MSRRSALIVKAAVWLFFLALFGWIVFFGTDF
jgi:hypothetical protein